MESSEARSGDLEAEEMARQMTLMASVVRKRISNWLRKSPGKPQIVLTNQVIQNACARLKTNDEQLLVVT